MRKGGYKIVDFKGAELTSTVVVRPGIYSQIIDDYDKAILVSGVSLSGSLKDDAFASVTEVTGDSGDSVKLGVYDGIITVTEDDEVTFALSTTPAELDAKIGDLDELETTDKDSLVGAVNEVVVNNLSMIFVNGTPTQTQLQNAELVIVWVNITGTSSYTPIICHPENLPYNISNGDISGSYELASANWNKAAGTLTTIEGYEISKTLLFMKGV